MDSSGLFVKERASFHRALMENEVLTVTASGVASNADSGQLASISCAGHIAGSLGAPFREKKLAAQSVGQRFETACANFVNATFLQLGHLRPGDWTVERLKRQRSGVPVARFAQYRHLAALDEAVRANQSLQAMLGNDYVITPDVVVHRAPFTALEINRQGSIVDESVAKRPMIRKLNGNFPTLHATISCKWTIRTDRAQNSRSEALNLIRNRKGRLPHIAVVTGEPEPDRISSLALGTGDIDCVYHFALYELVAAVAATGTKDAVELLKTMIEGNRLRDITDLPLDLAV